MAASETAKLLASLELKDKFSPTIKRANSALGKFDANLSKTEGRAYKAGQQIGTGFRNMGKLAAVGIGVVGANIAIGLHSLIELENQTAQTNAVIKSTGGIAGVTADQVGLLAEKYEALNATVGDEVIREGQNLLLTFTNITNKAFEPALAAALDMNTGLGKGPDGLTTTIKTLGKALNDPTKGLGALSKVGITFDKGQTKRIKQLQEEGKLLEAQEIILGEINKRFGGRFAAGGDTTAGAVAAAADAIEDLQRAGAEASLPAVKNISAALQELFADPEIRQGIKDLGTEVGKLFSKDNVKAGAKALGDAFALMRDAAPAIKAGLGAVATVLKTAVDAFTSLPKEVQALLIGGVAANKLTGGLVTNIAGGIFGALKAMTIQAGIVHLSGPVAGGGVPGGGGGKGGGMGAVAALGVAGFIVAAAVPIGEAFAAALPPELKGPGGKGESESQRRIREGIEQMKEKQGTTNEKITTLGVSFGRQVAGVKSTTERVKEAALETKREAARGLALVKSQTSTSGTGIQGTTRSSAAGIEAAVRASRPIITVDVDVSNKSITTVNTKVTRSGPQNGSRNEDSDGSGTYGNGGR